MSAWHDLHGCFLKFCLGKNKPIKHTSIRVASLTEQIFAVIARTYIKISMHKNCIINNTQKFQTKPQRNRFS